MILATWERVMAHVRAHYALAHEAEGFAELWWPLGGMRQHQTIRAGEAFGGLFVTVASALPRLDAEAALRDNARLAIGAFAVEDGIAMLRAGLVAPIDAGTLDRAMRAVAHEAARRTQVAVAPTSNPYAGLYATKVP